MTCINDDQPKNDANRKVCEEQNDVDVSVGDFILFNMMTYVTPEK